MNNDDEKIEYLLKIQELKEKGFYSTFCYNINSNLEDIKFEYENLKQQEFLNNLSLADKIIENKYNMSFIGGLLDEFNNFVKKKKEEEDN